MKNKKYKENIMMCFALLFIFSCASNLSEREAYELIIKLEKNQYYSRANFETYKFEAAYPNSEFMCDILNVRLKHLNRTDSLEGYRVDLKKKAKELDCIF
ncbi:hypothetical protein [Halobacteriovorax sp. YZS-1-1]|uniref:hypothetical protein n=1 Tax=unclassified Halobacteriovorax TaxID=2639665 RepID=UPI00399B1B55